MCVGSGIFGAVLSASGILSIWFLIEVKIRKRAQTKASTT
jgi:hypothetical protein